MTIMKEHEEKAGSRILGTNYLAVSLNHNIVW
jgi:hypothetical protein